MQAGAANDEAAVRRRAHNDPTMRET